MPWHCVGNWNQWLIIRHLLSRWEMLSSIGRWIIIRDGIGWGVKDDSCSIESDASQEYNIKVVLFIDLHERGCKWGRILISLSRIQTIEKRAAGLCCSFLNPRNQAFEKNMLTKSNSRNWECMPYEEKRSEHQYIKKFYRLLMVFRRSVYDDRELCL